MEGAFLLRLPYSGGEWAEKSGRGEESCTFDAVLLLLRRNQNGSRGDVAP